MSEYICIKHDSDACNACVKEMQALESQLALAREGLEFLASGKREVEPDGTFKQSWEIAREILAKLSEIK